MALVRVPISGTIGKAIRINPDATVGAQIGVNLLLPDGSTPTMAELADALYDASSPNDFVNEEDNSSGSSGFVFESDIVDGILLARVADNERITGAWQFNSLLMTNSASIDWVNANGTNEEFLDFVPVSSGGAAIEQQFGSSVADTNITSETEVTIKTLMAGGVLTVGDLYLLMARCGSRSDEDIAVRQGNDLRILYGAAALAEAKFGRTSGSAGPTPVVGEELSGWQIVTATASDPLTIKGHTYPAPNNSMTVNGAAFYALNLTDVGASNYQVSPGNGAATPITAAYVSAGASLTLSGADGVEDFLILYQVKGATDSVLTTLSIALTGGPWTGDEPISTIEPEHGFDGAQTLFDEREVFGMMVLKAPAASTTIQMRVKRDTTSGAPEAELLSSRIIAIKLSAFAEHSASFTLDQTDPVGAGEKRLETTTLVSTQVNGTEFAVFGGWHDFYPSSGFDSRGEINVDKDGGGDVVAGWDQNITADGSNTNRIPRHAWPLVTTTANSGQSLETTLDVIPAPNQAGEEWGSSSVVIVALVQGDAQTFLVGNATRETLIKGSSVKVDSTLNVTGAVDFDSTMNVDGNSTLVGTLNTQGAVDFDSTLNVDGASTFATVTATSYDGILAANLLDRTVNEIVTGRWDFESDGSAPQLCIVDSDSNGAATRAFIEFLGKGDVLTGRMGYLSAASGIFTIDNALPNAGVELKSAGVQKLRVDIDGTTVTGTIFVDNTSGEKIVLRDTNSTGDAVLNFIAFNDMNDLRQGFIGFGSSSNSKLSINNAVGDIVLAAANTDITGALTATSYGGVLEANLLDKSATETITGAYTFANNVTKIEGSAVRFIMSETGVGANEGKWRFLANIEQFEFGTLDDAEVGSNSIMLVTRTGIVVDAISFFAPITATSYDGILAANLLDKTANEAISGTWTHSAPLFVDAPVGGILLRLRDTGGTGTAANPYMTFLDSPAAQLGSFGFSSTGDSDIRLITNVGDIRLISAGGQIRLEDDTIVTGTLTADNVKRGTGTPEAAVVGIVGDIFQRTDGGAGTTLYVKESGTGNTGWVAK